MAALDTGADLDLLLSGEDFMRLGPEPRVLSAAKRVGRPCSVRTVSGEEIPIQYFELEVIVEASHNMTAPFRAKLIAARLDGVGLDGPSLVGAPLVRRLVAVGYSVDAAMGGSDGNLEDGGTSRGLRARVVHGGEREDDDLLRTPAGQPPSVWHNQGPHGPGVRLARDVLGPASPKPQLDKTQPAFEVQIALIMARSDLTPAEKDLAADIVRECKDAFAWDLDDAAVVTDIIPGVVLKPDAVPQRVPCHRARDPFTVATLEKEIAWGVPRGIYFPIADHETTFVSAAHAVRKHDGSGRMVVDLRHVNACSRSEGAHPLDLDTILASTDPGTPAPREDDLLGTADQIKAFTKIAVDAESAKHFAFSTPWGVYGMNRLPMGWVNSPFFLMRINAEAYAGLPVVFYMDDCLIRMPKESFFGALRAVLRRTIAKRWLLKPSPTLVAREAEYCGLTLTPMGYTASPSTFESLRSWPLESVHDLVVLIGRLGFIRKMIPKLDIALDPLQAVVTDAHRRANPHARGRIDKKLRLEDEPLWNETMRARVDEVYEMAAARLLLAYPNPKRLQ
jgi:hypothetical protein